MGDTTEPRGAIPFRYQRFDQSWIETEAEVIEEGQITVFVNGRELVSLMCTPRDPLQLAIGFLANEGLLNKYSEVEIEHVCSAGDCVDLWLSGPIWDRPRRRVITSGCGGGVTFTDLAIQQTPIAGTLQIEPQRLSELMRQLQQKNSLYARARGVHSAGLSDGSELLLVTEDIGRHNTVDRLRGECLRRSIDSAGMLLLTTGRISSEMIHKAAGMGCLIVASRTSPTSLSVRLAEEWNITLCGYLRRQSMNVYTHPERLMGQDPLDELGPRAVALAGTAGGSQP